MFCFQNNSFCNSFYVFLVFFLHFVLVQHYAICHSEQKSSSQSLFIRFHWAKQLSSFERRNIDVRNGKQQTRDPTIPKTWEKPRKNKSILLTILQLKMEWKSHKLTSFFCCNIFFSFFLYFTRDALSNVRFIDVFSFLNHWDDNNNIWNRCNSQTKPQSLYLLHAENSIQIEAASSIKYRNYEKKKMVQILSIRNSFVIFVLKMKNVCRIFFGSVLNAIWCYSPANTIH